MKKLKKAFTLVELMVVIAILAILATVSVVGYSSFITREKENGVVAEAQQAREIIIAEVIKNKEGKISVGFDGPTGTAEFSYDNGELYVITTSGTDGVNITYNENASDSGFDARLRKAFPNLASLPGFFTINGSVVYYHSNINNPAEDIVVDVTSEKLDIVKHADKDGEGSESGTSGTSTDNSIKVYFSQSVLRMSPGSSFDVYYGVIPEGKEVTFTKSGSGVFNYSYGNGVVHITALSDSSGTAYLHISAGSGNNSAKAKLTVIVDKNSKTPVALPKVKNTITYDGNVHGTDVQWDIPVGVVKKEVQTGSNPGHYLATFGLTDTNKYCWAIDGSIGDKQVEWIINKIKLATPRQIGEVHPFDGSSVIVDVLGRLDFLDVGFTQLLNALAVDKTPTWSSPIPDLVSSGKVTVENGKGRAPATYSATFTITDEAYKYYEWEDSKTKTINASWKIIAQKVSVPKIKGATFVDGVYEVPYDRDGITIYRKGLLREQTMLDGFNDEFDCISISGDTSGDTSGKIYTITFSLDTSLGDYKDVFVWEDGSTTSKQIKWKIVPKTFAKPVAVGTYKYNNSNQTAKWKNESEYSYEEGLILKTTHTIVSISGEKTAKDVGSHTATFTLQDTTNYRWEGVSGSTITADWYINKGDCPLTVSKSSTNLTNVTNTEVIISNSSTGSVSVSYPDNDYLTASIKGSGSNRYIEIVPKKQDDNEHNIILTVNDAGDSNYSSGSKAVTVTVKRKKQTSPLLLEKDSVEYSSTGTNTIKINNCSNYSNISVSSDDKSGYITVTKTQTGYNSNKTNYVQIKVNKLDSSEHTFTVTVTDAGNDDYEAGTKTITVKLKAKPKAASPLSLASSSVEYSSTGTNTVKITKYSSYNNISVSSDDNSGYITVQKKSSGGAYYVEIKVNKLDSSDHTFTVTVTDAGNDDYEAGTKTITVKLKKQKSAGILDVDNSGITFNKSGLSETRAINNSSGRNNLSVSVSGSAKNYVSAEISADGKSVIIKSKKNGNYWYYSSSSSTAKVTITDNGGDDYLSKSVDISITVKKS